MMESPLDRFPSLLGMSFWPFNPYYYAPPSLTVVNVEIHLQAPEQPPPVAEKPRSPKFWTNQCGIFIEIEASGTNLIDVENKPC